MYRKDKPYKIYKNSLYYRNKNKMMLTGVCTLITLIGFIKCNVNLILIIGIILCFLVLKIVRYFNIYYYHCKIFNTVTFNNVEDLCFKEGVINNDKNN